MSKPTLLISAPVDTHSGYGARSRDLVQSIIDLKGDELDIFILSQRWGDTPFGALDRESEYDQRIISRIVDLSSVQLPVDYFFMVSVPNEMLPQYKFGKYANWIFTAGVETDTTPPELIMGMNNADLTIFSSEFAKKSAEVSKYEQRDNNNQVINTVFLQKPTTVLFEGLEDIFVSGKQFDFDLSDIPEEKAFLITGHFLPGFEDLSDRKNIATAIKTFLLTFRNKKVKPALILKSSMGTYSYTDRENCLKLIKRIYDSVEGDLPNIYLIHGSLTTNQLIGLYQNKKVIAMIALGNEGYGRPELEFSASSKKPVIASAYGGHLDFLDPEFTVMVPGELYNVPKKYENMFLRSDSRLYRPNPDELSFIMKDLYENYSKYTEKAKRQSFRSKTLFTKAKMTERLKEIMEQYLPSIPKTLTIKLPDLIK